MNGREYVLDLEANDTILSATIVLEEQTGIPPDQERLTDNGKVLTNNRHFLKDYPIWTDSTLHFIPKTQKAFLESQRG